ncbi:stalk domain-containing protein [Defluviitalea phaphyphila]|uniref:stalk domain-containing protein n=1 Tax=Defluviitalea phaphyphila TaxID=1473580 RepID=UPI0007300068|nr:TolC family protein [Defluviitalea phaphyphila]
MKKYLKKMIFIVIMSLLLISSPLYASDTITLELNGTYHSLKISPVVEDETILINLREISELLGGTVSWNEETGEIKVYTNSKEISLFSDFKIAEINGNITELKTAPKKIDGNIMVSLKFIEEIFGVEAIWDQNNNRIYINTNQETSIGVDEVKSIEYPSLNINEEGTKITYEEAIKKALSNNLALKSIEEGIKISEEFEENARNAVVVQRPSVEDYSSEAAIFVSEAVHVNNLLTLIQAEYGVKAAKYQKQIQEGLIKYQVKSSFDSIQSLKKDIELLKKSLETSKIQLEITKQKVNLGLESDYNKIKAEQDYKKQENQLETLQRSLDTEYIKLNSLMGVDEKERFILDYQVEFMPIDMDENELDAYIGRALVKDPSIILKEEEVKQAEYNLHLYTYTGTISDSYDIRKSKLNQANLALNEAKDTLEDKIRTTYNQIKQLEEQYKINTLALEQAKDQYDIMKTQYNLGMVSEINLKQVELGILSAQVELEKTIIQHAQLVYLFNNPYLLQ